MAAGTVLLEIDQGEDFTADIIWTDSFDDAVNVVHPCRLDIKDGQGQIVLSLESQEDLPPGTIPEIAISSTGLLQIHVAASATGALPAGQYIYDLFVTADDGNAYAGPQRSRLLAGPCRVNKRVTIL